MLLNNFYNTVLWGSLNGSSSSEVTGRDLVDYSGKNFNSYYKAVISSGFSINLASSAMRTIADGSRIVVDAMYSNNTTYGVVFGDGSATPSLSDYKLSGNPVKGLSSSNTTYSITCVQEKGRIVNTVIYTITNGTGSEITINEVGILGLAYRTSSSSSSAYYSPILLERSVLESPVIIPVDGVGQVTYTYTIGFNDPTA